MLADLTPAQREKLGELTMKEIDYIVGGGESVTKVIQFPTAPHIADHLQEELRARGWSLDYLALRMAMSSQEFKDAMAVWRLTLDLTNEVRDVSCRLGDETAKALGRALGVSPEFLLNLDAAWRKSQEAAND